MIPGVILAGGASSRMGRAKALLPTANEGQTFLSQLVGTLWAGGVDDVVVVVSSLSGDVERALSKESLSYRLVVNHQPERGQMSSVLTALAAIDRPGVTGMLVTLVDMGRLYDQPPALNTVILLCLAGRCSTTCDGPINPSDSNPSSVLMRRPLSMFPLMTQVHSSILMTPKIT